MPAAGREKNETIFVERALAMLDCELEIIRMELTHPERFVAPPPAAPLAKWNGTISELLEVMVALHLAGQLKKPTGEQMTLADLFAFIESLFGIKLSQPYNRKSKLFARKKDDTPFLRKLIEIFETEAERLYM